MNDKLLLDAAEVAHAIGVKRSTMWKMINRGEIPSLKVGRLRRITRTAVEEWIEKKTTESIHVVE